MDEKTPSERTLPFQGGRRRRALITTFRVVIDACVLASATQRDLVLWSATLALYRPLWSEDILLEVERTLVDRLGVPAERARYVVEKMTSAFPEAKVAGYERLVPVMTNHPKDRHVLAAAVAGDAQLIVTDNLRDFPVEATAPHGIEVIGVDEFLLDLLDVDPERIVEVIVTLSERRRMPPKTIEEILLAAARANCPRFADAAAATIEAAFADR